MNETIKGRKEEKRGRGIIDPFTDAREKKARLAWRGLACVKKI